MEIITLENVEIDKIVNVLNLSFSDYMVPMHLNAEQLQLKILAENIQLDLSIGVFSSGQLVGFMLHALNELDGQLVAYNAATGVIPDYRGQGLVAAMYDHLLPKLKEIGVKQMVLEVIVGNNAAIRAYEKMDYKIYRTLHCFDGIVKEAPKKEPVVIKELTDFEWDTFTSFWSVQPSWQYTIKTLENSKDRCRILEASINQESVGYIIFNPTSRRILQIAVAASHRRKGIASQLVDTMVKAIDPKELFAYNVDSNSSEITSFLEKLGFSNTISQYEMKREI